MALGTWPGQFDVRLVTIRCKPGGPEDDSFLVHGSFTTVGLDPTSVAVIITVGSYTEVIPAGSFVLHDDGKYQYQAYGTPDGIKSARFDFIEGEYKITAKGADLSGTANPVPVKVQIGHVLCSADLVMDVKLDGKTGEPKMFKFKDQDGQPGTITLVP